MKKGLLVLSVLFTFFIGGCDGVDITTNNNTEEISTAINNTNNNTTTENITEDNTTEIQQQYKLIILDYDDSVLLEESFGYQADLSQLTIEEPTREGYSFIGWDQSIPSIMPENELVIKATYAINEYTISFESNEGSSVEAITQDYDSEIIEPTNPTREGYTFSGWYIDQALTTEYTFTNMPADDIVLYADWEVVNFNINYHVPNGDNHEDNPEAYTIETDMIELEEPTRTEAVFLGWYDNNLFEGQVIETIESGMTGDIDLYPKWDINEYNLSYHIYEAPQEDSVGFIDIDEKVVQFELTGDYDDKYFYVFFTDKNNVYTYGNNDFGQLGNGTTTSSDVLVNITDNFNFQEGEEILKINAGPYSVLLLTSNNRIFHWGIYGTDIDNPKKQTTPVDITSQFNLKQDELIEEFYIGSLQYSVLTSDNRVFMWGFNPGGILGNGNTVGSETPINIDEYFNLSENDYIIDMSLGYFFSSAISAKGHVYFWGYYRDNAYYDVTTYYTTPTLMNNILGFEDGEEALIIDSSHRMLAVYTSKNRVIYFIENSVTSDLGQFPLNDGELIKDLFIENYQYFAITSDNRLLAFGKNQQGELSIEFEETGDNTIEIPVDITDNFTLLEGEEILYFSATEYLSSVFTSLNRVLMFGQGTAIPYELNIVYDYSLSHEQTLEYDADIILNEPTLEGYDFNGWYIDEKLTVPFNEQTMVDYDLNLYGEWILSEYDIIYHLNEGWFENAAVTTFDIYTETILLPIPIKDGYSFDGWYDNSEFTGEPIIKISKGSKGDIQLYAKWIEPLEYEFHIDYFNEVTITSYTGEETELVIPKAINGFPVTEIGGYAFCDKSLISIVIPEGIEEISSYTFLSNELTSIVIPESVTYIGYGAFMDNNLTSITILGDETRFNDSWKSCGFPEELMPE